MAEYLSPSIGMVMPQLEQACDDLIRQSLIRALTDYTKQLCEFDPELADILLEGAKTLPRCVRYVLEKAQAVAVSQLEYGVPLSTAYRNTTSRFAKTA